jgi:DNA-directed RNA polymerase subunit RPC12/RpoP
VPPLGALRARTRAVNVIRVLRNGSLVEPQRSAAVAGETIPAYDHTGLYGATLGNAMSEQLAYGSPDPSRMSAPPAMAFACPTCGAKYKIVPVEAPAEAAADRDIACYDCGGPLRGRDGAFILKYFLVDPPKRRKRNRRSA